MTASTRPVASYDGSTTHTAQIELHIVLSTGEDADSDCIDVEVSFTYVPGTEPDPWHGEPGSAPEIEVHEAVQISGSVDYDNGRHEWTGDDLSIAGRVRDAIDADHGDVYEQLVAAAERDLNSPPWRQRRALDRHAARAVTGRVDSLKF